MPFHKTGLIIFLMSLFIASSASAQTVRQTVADSGTIDWSEYVIRVKGVGIEDTSASYSIRKARAIGDAKDDAYEKLVRIIKEIRINGDLQVSERADQVGELAQSLAAVARNFTVKDIRQLSRGKSKFQ